MKRRTFESKHGGHTFIDVDDYGLTIRRKGILSLINQGLKGEKTIPYSGISAVQLKKPGLTNGYIQFTVIGGNESKRGVFAATKDENTVMFSGINTYKEMITLKKIVERKISELHIPTSSTQLESESGFSKIKELKELFDSGALTEEEFTSKKKQILGI
jgi:hypothetical protein